jgi:hypothetical protein
MHLKLTAIPITDIQIGQRFRQDLGDIPVLAASIKANTLLHPIVVSREHVLIVGRRRLEACIQLGWTRIPAQVIDFDDTRAAEQDENEVRKDFTPSEKVAIGEVREEQEREGAKERQAQAGGKGNAKQKNGSAKLAEPFTGQARDIAAKAVGWSPMTYDKAKAVVHAARENPDYANIVEDMDRTGNVSAAYRQISDARRPLPRHRPSDPMPGAVLPRTPSGGLWRRVRPLDANLGHCRGNFRGAVREAPEYRLSRCIGTNIAHVRMALS